VMCSGELANPCSATAPATIIILLFNRAVLDLIICVIAIKAKVIGSLVSSNFFFEALALGADFWV
jgi:hypothetical protein